MNRIKECRLQRGLSQKFVSVSLGVAQPTVWGWENDKNQPSPDNYKKLADLFGVSVDYLVGREDAPAEPVKPTELEIKKEAPLPTPSEIDSALEALADPLTPEEVQQVLAFIAGMRAGRGR